LPTEETDATKTEISELEVTFRVDEQVVRLEIAENQEKRVSDDATIGASIREEVDEPVNDP
jgi:ribosomal protein S6